MGNPYSGYTMVVNPATSDKQLASGASIKVLYFSTPASLASPADVVTCPNPEYLIEGVIENLKNGDCLKCTLLKLYQIAFTDGRKELALILGNLMNKIVED